MSLVFSWGCFRLGIYLRSLLESPSAVLENRLNLSLAVLIFTLFVQFRPRSFSVFETVLLSHTGWLWNDSVAQTGLELLLLLLQSPPSPGLQVCARRLNLGSPFVSLELLKDSLSKHKSICVLSCLPEQGR